MALQFKISLNNTQPEVWRRIQILEGASLRTLHYAIQDVFWWRGTHSYIFNVGDEKYADPEYDYEFEGWLDDSKIKISRIVILWVRLSPCKFATLTTEEHLSAV